MSTELISLKELAQYSNPFNWQKEYCTIRKRAQRNKYQTYQILKGEGYVNISDPAIPVVVQVKIKNVENPVYGEKGKNPITTRNSLITINDGQSLNDKLMTNDQLPMTKELSPKQMEFALAAAKLVNLYVDHSNQPKFKGIKTQAQERFTAAYNNKAFPDIFEIIGERDVQTIRKWKKRYIDSGKDYRVLAPQYKTKRPSSITPEQAQILITLLLKPNKPLISEVVRDAINIFEAKRFPHIRCKNTYKSFLEDWKKENYADYVFHRIGEQGLDDFVLPYLERDWNLVEVGDIIIMDGHVNNYEIINPFPPGMPKRMITVGAIDGRSQYLAGYEIAITENILSIASALRRAILNLGMIPKVVYIDNGKAFSAKYFHGANDLDNLQPLFERLGIRVIFAKAYHAQSKPIEPFWDWMSELERLIPTYTGTSIEMKPPRMNRGEFLHRKLYEKAMHNTTFDIFAAHRGMSWWLDQYHNREKTSGHLKGLTPGEVFGAGKNTEGILCTDRKTFINREELNFLMMDHAITKLYRKGIRMFGNKWYWHESLFGKLIDAGDEVHIKYDIFDQDYILVYDRHGELVCKAFDVSKVHPAAAILGTEEEVNEVKRQLAQKERLKSSVVGEARLFLQNEIYPFVQKQLNDANILQLPESTSTNEKIEDSKTANNNKKGEKKKRRSVTDYLKVPDEFETKNIDLISKTA